MKKITLIILLFLSTTLAQIPGKIVGRVTDAASLPLPGVNVLVEGELLGASTDVDGFFMIINIAPGTYSLKATFVGYQTTTIQQVIIQPDLTTKLDFTLYEEAIELGETIVVVAEQPVIQRDATAKVSTMNADEIQTMPVNSLQEILSTQSNVSILSNTPNAKAGYNIRGIDDIRMRGGRSGEVALLIDGVKVSNPVFGGFGTQIGKNAIEQIAIESGGFSAKYGNALSGVINLTTKDGREKMSGALRYLTSQPFGIEALATERGNAQARQNIQFSISGKIPLGNKISYFLSTEINAQSGTVLQFDNLLWDDYRHVSIDGDSSLLLPSSAEIEAGYLYYQNLDSIQPGLGSNWKLVEGPDGRTVNPLDQHKGWQGLGWNNFYNFYGKFGYALSPSFRVRFSVLAEQRYRQYNNFNAWYIYQMSGQNVQLLNSDKETITINHTLSNTTFYDLKLSRFYERRKIRILNDYNQKYAPLGNTSLDNVFEPAHDNFKEPSEYIPYLSSEAIRDPFENSFYMLADNRWYSGDESANYEARLDFTTQFHPKHKIEAGFQYNYIDLHYHSYQNISDVDAYPTVYHYTPMEGALYFHLKSELDKLIINAGLRLDYNDSGGEFWEDPFDPLGEQSTGSDSIVYNSLQRVDANLNLSPRIGIAYPLTASTVLFFNFGHFYQNANYRDMYRASGDAREVSIVRGNIIGNPSLKPEKAVQYEISLQQQVANDIGIKLNLWLKETTNQVGSVTVPAYSDPEKQNPFSYAVFINNNFGSARGIDMEVKKSLRGNFAFQVNYTYSISKVLQPSSWDGYWSGDTEDEKPRSETTAPWDQTHVVRANMQYVVGHEEGLHLDGIYPFQNSTLSILYFAESGLPYSPTIPGGVITEPYSQRWPASHRVDLRISKLWPVWENRCRVFIEVKNIMDRKNVLEGYTRTGSAEDPGTASYYSRSSTYWDSRNNNNYALRRTVYFGLEFIFGS